MMLEFHLNLSLEVGDKLQHKTIPLVNRFISMLESTFIFNILFPNIIFEESSYNFQKVLFIPSISLSINY